MAFLPTWGAKYPDVPEDHWARDGITLATWLGLFKGDKDTGNFRPDDLLKRSEAATVSVRLVGVMLLTGAGFFTIGMLIKGRQK